MRFPPPSRRYSPISVMTSTSDTASRWNSRSMASRSSRNRSKTSLATAPELVDVLTLVGPVIGKLHVDAEVFAFKSRDDLLQCVAIFAAYAHGVTLDGSLHLQLRILNELHNFTCLFDRNALLQLHSLAHGRSRRRFDSAIVKTLEGYMALHQLVLQDVVDRLRLVIVDRRKHDRFLAFKGDVGFRILEIKTRVNLFDRLLDGVGFLLQVDLAHYVEGVVNGHDG